MISSVFPDAKIFRAASGEPRLRWGILAPGRIAHAFAQSMRANTVQAVTAVASRSPERAHVFASAHGIQRVHATYERLVEDADVDVVYVAAPASLHTELGLLALHAGKHVLIEKPLATNGSDARRLVELAQRERLMLMEAMWSRYLPQASVIRTLVSDGAIGEVRAVIADHSQAIPSDPGHRMNRPDLGGGALLDLGIYPIQLDSMVLGRPSAVTAIGGLSESGVDAHATVVLDHGHMVQSTITTSMLTRGGSAASVRGTIGRLDVAGPHHTPTSLTLHDNNLLGPRLTWQDPTGVTLYGGLCWEMTALATFVGEGRIESPLHTLEETISILETIDQARAQIQVRASVAALNGGA